MASLKHGLVRLGEPLSSLCLRASPRAASVRAVAPFDQIRWKSMNTKKVGQSKKKKESKEFQVNDLKKAEYYSLCDAMHYIRSFEVGVPPTSAKYDLALRFKTLKSGPVVRNRMRLPHPVKTDLRICVIAPRDSKAGKDAIASGAVLVGEEDVFNTIKDGNINFDRCICHVDSLQKMAKAGMGRILGPKGLMPSTKVGTVVKDISGTVRDMVGGCEYRERQGVVRMSIGQLGFKPEEVKKNIGAFMAMVKKDINALSDRMTKDIHEVVLSSTHSPGFLLNGDFRSHGGVSPEELSTIS